MAIFSATDPSGEIIMMASSMFIVTFFMGYLPTRLSAPQKIMNLISLYGAGLLVGAALIVIVPEGMTVLFNAVTEQEKPLTPAERHETDELINRYVGLSLIVGFTIMLMIDQGFLILQEKKGYKEENEVSNTHHENEHVELQGHSTPLILSSKKDFESYDTMSQSVSETRVIEEKQHKLDHNIKAASHQIKVHSQHKKEGDQVFVTTIGLVIHCFADGMALGTSVFLSSKFATESGLGILIFLAILLHKAPGAIGFGTFLFHAGLQGWAASKHLLAFTLACPITSILAYFTLANLQLGSDQTSLMFWVGILLIISAGSFIYVATIHILPEVLYDKDTHGHSGHEHVHEKGQKREDKHFRREIELACMILGLVSPFALTFLQDE